VLAKANADDALNGAVGHIGACPSRQHERVNDMDIAGTWELIGFAETQSTARLIGEDTDPADIDAWLNRHDDSLLSDAEAASGLRLRIDAGNFTEERTGSPSVSWFDAEGVLAEEVAPFDGTLIRTEDGIYLRPAVIPSWAMPVDGRHGPAVLRYDDSDTKIAESLHLAGERLMRTVNVVTDELYLNRVVLIYARDSDA
jgi:hypothetical protein